MEASENFIKWDEYRDGELFFIIAEKEEDGRWVIYERSTWEVEWYVVSSDRLAQELQSIKNQECSLIACE